MAVISFVTKLGLVIWILLTCWEAYVERNSPARHRKMAAVVVAVLVTAGRLYLEQVHAREMAFVKAVSAASAHAMLGGL